MTRNLTSERKEWGGWWERTTENKHQVHARLLLGHNILFVVSGAHKHVILGCKLAAGREDCPGDDSAGRGKSCVLHQRVRTNFVKKADIAIFCVMGLNQRGQLIHFLIFHFYWKLVPLDLQVVCVCKHYMGIGIGLKASSVFV